MSPSSFLIEPCPLRAQIVPHITKIGRCPACGDPGCVSVKVRIRREDDRVLWQSLLLPLEVRFDASQYEAEINRATHDFSWETPRWTAARFVRESVDRLTLRKRGFVFEWASSFQGAMTVCLMLRPGPYQIVVRLPWDGKDVRGIAAQFTALLKEPPELWPDVECYPQDFGLREPYFMQGSSVPDSLARGWRRTKS